ncbi:hypothetical protein EVAR_90387_1 [Eumeta japonica]|uniref:Uncharacterized protein n=1 Tax=Eumeta variegata TaxID=151549 RepID=A0A4C1ZVF1_EUMVA|nr:hypothetical protein EVAR_90387_1 [Eumeta japonica]
MKYLTFDTELNYGGRYSFNEPFQRKGWKSMKVFVAANPMKCTHKSEVDRNKQEDSAYLDLVDTKITGVEDKEGRVKLQR